MKIVSKYYLICQLTGWGITASIMLLMSFCAADRLLIMVIVGLLVSHLLRSVIVRYGWLGLPVKGALPRLITGVILACIVAAIVKRAIFTGMGYPHLGTFFLAADAAEYSFLLVPWGIMYYLYNYVAMTRRVKVKKKELELRVMEMKKQSEESGVDVQVIMDSLRRIKQSIGEDPARCRAEITAFSKLLRHGYLSR
jgi:hypothetical protein